MNPGSAVMLFSDRIHNIATSVIIIVEMFSSTVRSRSVSEPPGTQFPSTVTPSTKTSARHYVFTKQFATQISFLQAVVEKGPKIFSKTFWR